MIWMFKNKVNICNGSTNETMVRSLYFIFKLLFYWFWNLCVTLLRKTHAKFWTDVQMIIVCTLIYGFEITTVYNDENHHKAALIGLLNFSMSGYAVRETEEHAFGKEHDFVGIVGAIHWIFLCVLGYAVQFLAYIFFLASEPEMTEPHALIPSSGWYNFSKLLSLSETILTIFYCLTGTFCLLRHPLEYKQAFGYQPVFLYTESLIIKFKAFMINVIKHVSPYIKFDFDGINKANYVHDQMQYLFFYLLFDAKYSIVNISIKWDTMLVKMLRYTLKNLIQVQQFSDKVHILNRRTWWYHFYKNAKDNASCTFFTNQSQLQQFVWQSIRTYVLILLELITNYASAMIIASILIFNERIHLHLNTNPKYHMENTYAWFYSCFALLVGITILVRDIRGSSWKQLNPFYLYYLSKYYLVTFLLGLCFVVICICFFLVTHMQLSFNYGHNYNHNAHFIIRLIELIFSIGYLITAGEWLICILAWNYFESKIQVRAMIMQIIKQSAMHIGLISILHFVFCMTSFINGNATTFNFRYATHMPALPRIFHLSIIVKCCYGVFIPNYFLIPQLIMELSNPTIEFEAKQRSLSNFAMILPQFLRIWIDTLLTQQILLKYYIENNRDICHLILEYVEGSVRRKRLSLLFSGT